MAYIVNVAQPHEYSLPPPEGIVGERVRAHRWTSRTQFSAELVDGA